MGGRKNNLIVQLLCLTFLLLAVFSCSQNSEAAIRKEFNYQGKLTDSNGLAVADGAYDITFKIYTQAGGGSAVFTESWTNATLFTESATTVTNDGCAAGVDKIAYVTGTNEASLKAGQTLWNSTTKQSAVIESVVTGSNYICIYDPATAWTSGNTVTNRIYVKNGLFSTMVGSVTASTLGFTGDTYYLGVTIGTDSEMIPRKKIGSVPQAWNANNLSGDGIIDIDNNSATQDAANISYNPTSGTYNAFSIIYGSGGGTGTALSVVQNGTGNIVDFKDGSTSVFKIADGGTLTIVATTNITGNTSVTGNLNVSGVINGGADMAPNLVKNSYMNILDGSVPAGYSGTGVTIEATSAYTKAFEGCYASSNAAPCDAATPDDATLASQYWYSSYNKGPRIQRGGLAGGWSSLSDGNILKITGTGITPGSHSYVSMPFEKNVLGSTWHFKAWVKIVAGSQACFGSDAGYLGNANGICVTKAVADAADQGWYRFNGTTTTSQITSLGSLALSFGAIPDGSGNVEMYVALPYVANLNTYGTNKETWVPSIADSMSRNGLTIHPTTYNVGIGTTSPTSRLDVAYNSTGTALTVTQSGTGKIVDFKDGSTSALTVIDGGNVGIGTDSPSAKLNIYQNAPTANQVLFRVGTSDNSDRFYIDEDGDVVFGTGAQVNFSNGDATGLNSITIADPGASEGFRFNATAAGWYVDVSPLDRSNADGNLNLYGTANNIAFWRPTLWVYNSTNYTSATPTSTGGLDFTTTGTGDITFNPGGNLGIGTSSLSAKLTVSQASTGDVVDFKDGSVSVFKIADGGNITMTALNFEQGVVAPVLKGSILSSTYMDAASAVAAQGKYAYVAGYGTDYLSVVDVSNPASPVIVGSVTNSSRLDAVTGVFVSGKYAYTTGSNQDYLSVFDISNPYAPTLASSLQDTTRMDGASAIYVSGRHAFVTSFNNDYLAIEDISYPTPVLEGSLQSATYMDGARGVYVQGAYAYIAGFNSDSLAVVNVANTGAPTLAGNLVNATYMDGARGVYVSGKYAYIVAENSDSLAIVNIGNPAIPTLAGYLVDSTNLNGARSIQVSGKYAYIASSANNSISIVDVSNPASPTFVTSLVDATNMAGAQSVFVRGKYAFVASETSDSLSVVEISGFDLPTAKVGDLNAGSLDVDDNASIGNNLYVGNGINVGVGGISSAGEIAGYTSSTRSALWISQAGTGDIMTLRDGTTSVFRVVDGGTVYATNVYPLSGNAYSSGSSAWDSTADFTITGEATSNYLGGALAAAGDLNGDGYQDLVTGANGYSSSTGRVYVYYGASTFNTTVDVTLNGLASSDFGYSVAGIGDVNGDGFDDLIVGAKSLNGTGEAYVYYGGSAMDATADVTLAAVGGDSNFGVNVDFAGDVNSDGFADVLVGADGYDSSRGHAYLYFGGTAMDATPDLTFTGENVGDLLGVQVSRAGDVNSDGFDDIVIGAGGYSTATGRAYIHYGGSAMDNTADVVLTGSATGLNFAKTGVAGIGDFNGDTYDDIIIGATGYTTNTGQEYIYFGGAPMNNVVDGTFTGAGTNYYFGNAAAPTGDYNGDGFMDFIVGAYGYTTNTGRAYVYYGGLTVDTGVDITITGAAVSTSFGKSLAAAVDLNRDGVKDIVIGAPEYTTSTGRVYVYNTVNYTWKSTWTQSVNVSRNIYINGGLTMNSRGINTVNQFGIYTPTWTIDRQGSATLNKLEVNQNSTASALTVKQDGTGNIADFKDGTTSVFTIADGGNITMNARNFTQNAVNPVHKGSIADDATTELLGAHSIYVSGKYAYVTGYYDNGVEILDISNPASPTHVGAIADDANTALTGPKAIFVFGGYAYISSESDRGIEILDISNPASPTHVGKILDNATTELYGPESVYVSGKYAYVASFDDDGVEILDISNPASPIHAGAISDDGTTELNGAYDIYISGKYAYVASNVDDGVEILDISNPASPTHVGAITDDGTTELDGPISIYVSGKYAYVASSFTLGGVEILDISNPASPTHVGAITDDANTALSGPKSIYVSGKYAYVASSEGVEILDVSDPSSPIHSGVIFDDGTTLLDSAFSIVLSGKYAYVTSSNEHGVEVLELSGFDLPTANIGDLSTSTLDVTDNANVANNLYVGNGLNVGQGGIYASGPISGNASSSASALSISQNGTGNIMDLKDGTISVFTIADGGNITMNARTFAQNAVNPVHKGVIIDSGSTELLGSVGVSVQGKYAYVAAYDDDGVEVLDISNPASPIHIGFITDDATTELDGASYIHVSGKYAYIASEVDDGVEILDVSNPAAPVHIGAITDDATTLLDGAACIYVSGKYAYVAATVDDGIEVLDISDPANPTHVGKIADDATAELDGVYSVYVSGKYLYAAGTTDDGFEVMDISDPANPTHVGAITDNVTTELDGAADVYVSGKYAYVTGYNDDGVEILDISNPASPTHVGAITDNATTELDGAWPIRVSGKYAYVGSLDDDGVEILDISNPASPTHVGAITDDGTTALNTVYSLYIQGKYIYATSGSDNGVEVLEVAGFDLPTANIGDLSVSTIDVTDNANIANDLYVGNGLSVGSGGIYSSGSIGVFTDSAVAALTISQNGTGDLIDIKKTGGSIFKITQATVEIAQPLDVQVEGDVGIEYNLSFMNTSTSFINSAGPLTISAGDSNSYENLTLTTSGTGDVIVDIAGSTMGFRIVGTETTVFNVDGSGNVVIGGVNSSNADLTVKRNITTQGGNLALGSLATPSGVAVTPVGTAGSTTYGYRISAINGNGETIAATTVSTATGNATLSATNYNRITWSAVTGATGYKVYGRTSSSELYMATVNSPTLLYNDTGTVTPSGALPTSNTTGGTITYPATGGPKRSIILTAAGAETPTTNGAAQTKVDGTNHTYFVLDYDATTDESAYWHWTMPDSYNGGAIDITYYWEAAATSAEVGWCFQAIGVQANNAEDVDSALSSAVCEVDTAQANANDLALVTELQATSNFAAGDYVSFKVFRDADQSTVGAGNDDMAGDARLVKVKIEYGVNAESD
jgi:uncharacterized protein YkvS